MALPCALRAYWLPLPLSASVCWCSNAFSACSLGACSPSAPGDARDSQRNAGNSSSAPLPSSKMACMWVGSSDGGRQPQPGCGWPWTQARWLLRGSGRDSAGSSACCAEVVMPSAANTCAGCSSWTCSSVTQAGQRPAERPNARTSTRSRWPLTRSSKPAGTGPAWTATQASTRTSATASRTRAGAGMRMAGAQERRPRRAGVRAMA